ncbi:MAG TPA: heme o synthase [Candidatus Limnocylindria bacterium]|nr:heme o synthase [Candidatus Limnocylindria bacterium]
MSIALASPRARRLALAYLDLTKPRIVSLVLVTGLPALLMAAGGWPAPHVLWGALAGITFAAASAASFNHYVDRDIDALMRRTAARPLPSGLVPPSHAVVLGVALAGLAWVTLVTLTNLLAAMLAMASIIYYAVIYSVWLKRRTPQNIVIGGGAGASAPLIAWAAVTGGVSLPAVILSLIIFLWTPPHFWALALYRRDDYARANLPMLPVTHGETETRRQIVLYTLALIPVTLVLWPLQSVGLVYAIPAALLGGMFLYYALRLRRTGTTLHAVHLFRFSILYLFALFALLTLDAVVRGAWLSRAV